MENDNITNEELIQNIEKANENTNLNNNKNKKKKALYIILIFLLIFLVIISIYYFTMKNNRKDAKETTNAETKKYNSPYTMSGNGLEDFDLYFLQLENKRENKIYSPLSIKYALGMLEEGTASDSKEQISNIIGSYSSKKYENSENISLANALFIKDSYKESVKQSYIDTLSSKYNAEVIFDSFATPNNINTWVSNKTFNLINNIADDISNNNFILTNALAINMDWVKKIQPKTFDDRDYSVYFAHEKYAKTIFPIEVTDYHLLEFENLNHKAKSVEIGAVINKYDILKELGEDKIRENISNEYQKWLNTPYNGSCEPGKDLDVNSYVNKYIDEINSNYKHISSSTDFNFYDDEDIKMFSKDLKEYNGTTLQYIGIMPKNTNLDEYIKDVKASNINELINKLKPIELDSFKDGVVTEIKGYIPLFQFDYELNLKDDLKKLGITDVFDEDKANLSNLTTNKSYVEKVSHKSNIEFSNEGIKASAVTIGGGLGDGTCGFEYLYDVPVEEIDLTFDKPYLFLIRDKETGEVWFTGTVYEPLDYTPFLKQ